MVPRAALPLIAAIAVGCSSSQHRPGDPLVVTGAAVAGTTAYVATHQRVAGCPYLHLGRGCAAHGSTSNRKSQTAAAIGVAAGVALAAIGHAINERHRYADSDPNAPLPQHPAATYALSNDPEAPAREYWERQNGKESAGRAPATDRENEDAARPNGDPDPTER